MPYGAYWFRCKARNSAGEGPWGNEVKIIASLAPYNLKMKLNDDPLSVDC